MEGKLKESSDERKAEEKVQDAEVEGYAYCATDKQRCMQDCNGTALLSTLN